MKHYVLLFRSSRQLTPEELKQRVGDLRNWIEHVNAEGVRLDPRNLEAEATQFSLQDGAVVARQGTGDASLITMVFFDAADRERALEVARTHPGPHYGVTVELREWNPPQLPLAMQR